MDKLKGDIIFSKKLRPNLIGLTGEVFETVSSTMNTAIEKARNNCPDGYVVAAEYQTEGRGRTGYWESNAGKSLLLSIILKANFRPEDRMLVGIMGAVASTEMLINAGVKSGIKWPNDIVVLPEPTKISSMKKIGGVLIEQFSRGDAAPGHVLGIGLNINQKIDELSQNTLVAPTSARIESGKVLDRNKLCVSLFDRLDYWYKKLRMAKTEDLLLKWKNLSSLVNKNIKIIHKNRTVSGVAIGLSADGKLIFECRDGQKLYMSDTDARVLLQ